MTIDTLNEIITSLEDLKPWQRFAVAHVDELIVYLEEREREMRCRVAEELTQESERLGTYGTRSDA